MSAGVMAAPAEFETYYTPGTLGACVAPDGTKIGDPIPGSRFVRSFCRSCGEPMRHGSHDGVVIWDMYCRECEPPWRAPRLPRIGRSVIESMDWNGASDRNNNQEPRHESERSCDENE